MRWSFYYLKTNRNSINALAGALESDPFFDSAEIVFPSTGDELLKAVHYVLASGLRTAVAISFATTQLWAVRDIVSRLRSLFGSRAAYFHAGGP